MIEKIHSIAIKKKKRVRYALKKRNKGERLRISVFKSVKYFYAQIIDDSKGITIASASTKGVNKQTVQKAASLIAQRLTDKEHRQFFFDRGSYVYTGVIKTFANTLRDLGMQF